MSPYFKNFISGSLWLIKAHWDSKRLKERVESHSLFQFLLWWAQIWNFEDSWDRFEKPLNLGNWSLNFWFATNDRGSVHWKQNTLFWDTKLVNDFHLKHLEKQALCCSIFYIKKRRLKFGFIRNIYHYSVGKRLNGPNFRCSKDLTEKANFFHCKD